MSNSLVPRSSKPFSPPKTVKNTKLTGTPIRPPSVHSLGSMLKPPSQPKPKKSKSKTKTSGKQPRTNGTGRMPKSPMPKSPKSGRMRTTTAADAIAKALAGKPSSQTSVTKALSNALAGKVTPVPTAKGSVPVILPK